MPYETIKPKWRQTKRFLRDRNHDLRMEIGALQHDLHQAHSATAIADEEAKQWRRAYETAVNTPETKADTEAAFKRGEQMARMRFAAWLRQMSIDMLGDA